MTNQRDLVAELVDLLESEDEVQVSVMDVLDHLASMGAKLVPDEEGESSRAYFSGFRKED